MIWLQKLLLLLPSVRRKREKVLEDELQSHLEMAAQEAHKTGLSADDAYFAARRDVGSLLRAKEDVRSEWIPGWFEGVLQDARYAVRALGRAPLFSGIAILSLALGIGAANAVFALVEGILLRPLAYPNSGQLVFIQEVVPPLAHVYPSMPVNVQHFFYWRDHARMFRGLSALRSSSPTLTGGGEPEQIDGVETSAELFRVLKTDMAMGRGFLPGEDQPGKGDVAVITNSLWHRRLHGAANVIGQSIILDGKPATIVGVLRSDFTFPKGDDLGSLEGLGKRTELFRPIQNVVDGWDGDYDYAVIGRLRLDVTLKQGLAELAVLTSQMAKAHQVESQPRPTGKALHDVIGGSVRTSLLVLLTAVLVLLLIVCVNLANLMLARANGRIREFSIRTALGADRRRLFQQLVTEAFVLSLAGGLLGISLSIFAVRLFIAHTRLMIPRLDEVHVDARVMLFSLFITALCACLFGLIPAYRISKSDLQEALRASGQAATTSKQSLRLRELLVGCEVALSTVLVFLAGLLISSLAHLMSVDKGFHEERAVAINISLPETQYHDPVSRNKFFERALSQLIRLPGVQSAALINALPLTGESQVNGVDLEGSAGDFIDPANRTNPIMINVRFVSPGYFETLGIPLLAGRPIEQQDRQRHVTVISALMAARIWPRQNPLGKKFKTGSNVNEVEVVGIVRDTYNGKLDQQPTLIAYVPYWIRTPSYGSLVVRSSSETEPLMRAMQKTIWSIDASLPVSEVKTMADVVAESTARRRFQMQLAAAFGVGALMLALIGIYGVVAYNVEQRRKELGLRMALGANKSELVALVMKRGLGPVLAGLLSGLFLSLALGRLVRSLVFGVTTNDPLTIGGVVIVLAVTASIACLLPASRAARMDAALILRRD